jgi:hypothetical protein
MPELNVLPISPQDRVMAKLIEDLSQFLQSFGVAGLALLFLPVLIAALARNVALALATSLLSFTSLMLFIAPASATSGLAIVSGLGSFLVALESIVARGRMMAFNKEVADLSSRVNQLESAEQRRLALEVKRRNRRKQNFAKEVIAREEFGLNTLHASLVRSAELSMKAFEQAAQRAELSTTEFEQVAEVAAKANELSAELQRLREAQKNFRFAREERDGGDFGIVDLPAGYLSSPRKH